MLTAIALGSCQSSPSISEKEPVVSRLDTQLVLNNAVLEQSNKQDNTVWKIKAERIAYSEDRQVGTLEKVVGNLLQDGRTILKISAEAGKIKQNGNVILLEEKIVVQDLRNESIIHSEAIEWRPQENLLLITDRLTGTHPNLEVNANTGEYSTDTEKLSIQGDVVVNTNEPALQLNSDRLEWHIPQAKISAPNPLQIVRYDRNKVVTDRLVSDRAELELAQNTALLQQNIELTSSDPPLQLATNNLSWNYEDRIANAEQPILILDRDRQIELTGNKGSVDFPQRLAKLKEGAKGINRQQNSELFARQLTWKIDGEEVEARGDVVYEQVNPSARLTGEKAIGTLKDNNIVITSNGKQQVTSIIEN